MSDPACRPSVLARTMAGLLDRVLDPTIVLSFDRTGYSRHAMGFDPADLDVDLAGRNCLVTGANSGIGLATARGLAARGASVWLLCRSAERGQAAATEIRRDTGSRRVHVAELDVSDLESVRHFAAELSIRKVDVLVHNAGVLPYERTLTRDGYELTLATNVLGPFLLTALLRPRLAAGARVIWVSSGGMYTTRLSLDDVQWAERPFDGVAAYAQTKRMQVVLSEMLAGRLADQDVLVNSMHPGWANTSAVKTSLPRFYTLTRRILRSPEQGADTVLWLAASPAAAGQSGLFWFDRRTRPTHLLRRTRETVAERRDLWQLCARLTGARFD